jgi:hypothetical protein
MYQAGQQLALFILFIVVGTVHALPLLGQLRQFGGDGFG